MQVREIMTSSVDVIAPNRTIVDAAKRMRDENIGALPVGENDRLVGMVTDRDICCRAVAESKAPTDCTVRDVMSEKVTYCFDDDSTEEAARHMAEYQVRRLPVLNRDKRLVGIIALGDIARESARGTKTATKGVSEPSQEPRSMH